MARIPTLSWGFLNAPAAPAAPVVAPQAPKEVPLSMDDDPLTLAEIIKKKPKTKLVREFFAASLSSIRSEEDMLFSDQC